MFWAPILSRSLLCHFLFQQLVHHQLVLCDDAVALIERPVRFVPKRVISFVAGVPFQQGLTIRDEGLSGYHGVHRKRGALGRFVKRFLAGEISAGGVFICEAFDRFTREAPRVAQQLFLTLNHSKSSRSSMVNVFSRNH